MKATNQQEEPTKSVYSDDERYTKAATVLQSRYRGYRARRTLRSLNLEQPSNGLSTSARWADALTRQRLERASKEQAEARNDPGSRWKRGAFIAGRIVEGGGGDSSEQGGGQTDQRLKEQVSKQMEARYWLELGKDAPG
jgi:hypothetical protein